MASAMAAQRSSTLWAAARFIDAAGGGPRPCGLARTSPRSRHARTQRIALETLTPKPAAACRRDVPASTAATTRTRRSSERLFPMHAGLLSRHRGRITTPPKKGIPFRLNQLENRSSSRCYAIGRLARERELDFRSCKGLSGTCRGRARGPACLALLGRGDGHALPAFLGGGARGAWAHGVEPRSKVSMTIMRPPQDGQG